MFMTSNDFQNQNFQRKIQLYQISSPFSFLTPQKCIKHIEKFNFGLPQNLTHNHIYQN